MEETYTLAVKNCSSEDDHHLYDCSIGPGFGRSDQQHVFHSYYQWVPLVLVLQAAFCYLPWLETLMLLFLKFELLQVFLEKD